MPGCKLEVVTLLSSKKWMCVNGCRGNQGRDGTGCLFNQVGISRFERGTRQLDAPGAASQGENRPQIVCERVRDGREAGGVFFTLPGSISHILARQGGIQSARTRTQHQWLCWKKRWGQKEDEADGSAQFHLRRLKCDGQKGAFTAVDLLAEAS